MGFMDKAKAESQKQQEKAEERGNFEKVNWWKPELGENLVRLLPHWTGDADELFFHRNVVHWNVEIPKGDGSGTVALAVRCLKEFKKDCPLCDQYEKASTEEKKDLQSQRPAEQYLYNIYDIKKKGFFVYGAPVTVHTQFWEWVEDFGADPSSHKTGRNWKIIKKTDGSGKMNVKYSVRPSMDPSEFPVELIPKFEEEKVDLSSINSEDHEASIYKAAGVSVGSGGADDGEFAESKTDGDGFAEPKPGMEDDIPFNDGFAEEKGSSKVSENSGPNGDSEPVKAKFKMEKKEEERELTPQEFGINIEDDELEKQLKELGVEA